MDWATTWQWWLAHGLDGIGGGLVGGGVTALAVWLTLRHERTLAERRALVETAAHTETTLVRHMLQLSAERDWVVANFAQWYAELHHIVGALRVSAAASDSDLAGDLLAFSRYLIRMSSEPSD